MDFFGFISLFGGLALFLYGMSVLGGSLEHPDLRRLVCQMGKEAEGFRIVSLE